MTHLFYPVALLLATCSPFTGQAKFKNLELDAVRWTDGFWKQRYDHLHHVLIPGTIDGSCLIDGNGANFNNFRRAAGIDDTPYVNAASWGDGDCYYLLEVISRVYAVTKDPALDARLDYWIGIISQTQQPDGYIGTRVSLGVDQKWASNSSAGYNMGHLLQAAIAHQRATGKHTLMVIANKAVDAIYAYFEESLKSGKDQKILNMSLIVDLIDFYRFTDDKRCLEIAQWNIDHKGKVKNLSGDQWQDGPPLRDEIEAVGHGCALPWTYLSAAKMFAETGEQALWDVSKRLWDDIHATKYHIHGGYGGNPDPGLFKSPIRVINGKTYGGDSTHEGYGPAYQLLNTLLSCESCANFDAALWGFELFESTGNARYMDAIERILYNSLLGGIDLDEARWFYSTPHERRSTDTFNSDRTHDRWNVRRGFCCPPNLMKGIAYTSQWAYSIGTTGVWVNLYGENFLKTTFADGAPIHVTQKSDYPWSGDITIELKQADGCFDLNLRIPSWVDVTPIVTVNGASIEGIPVPGTYFKINRRWKTGDRISLELPMNVRFVESHPKIVGNRNRVAIFRGPLLYVQEQHDLPKDVAIDDIILPGDIQFTLSEEDWPMLKRVRVLESRAVMGAAPNAAAPSLDYNGWEGRLYRNFLGRTDDLTGTTPVTIKLIPYFAWGNRTEPYILAWFPLPGSERVVEPVPQRGP